MIDAIKVKIANVIKMLGKNAKTSVMRMTEPQAAVAAVGILVAFAVAVAI
jgi:hypothetical protein